MKEKLERFSKGDFEYELPFICLSEEEIMVTVEAGRAAEGSFTIKNSEERPMKGIVYSSVRNMQIENPAFYEAENLIRYHFDAAYVKEGQSINGNLMIISDCGEKSLPFTVLAEAPFIQTSMGKIKDLFQFTNLARIDWSEAKKVFRSEDFERIFLNNEARVKSIYRNLLKSISTSQALEEFLITIRKKDVICLNVDKTQLEYHNIQDNITDKLTVTKSNWGYAEIRVSSDEPFIQLEQKFLWADRFVSNTHPISFTIHQKALKPGNNFGHIFIKTAHQTITVDVICKYTREGHGSAESRFRQKTEVGLTDNYLSFRLNRIDLGQYLEEAQSLMKQLPGPEVSRLRELLKIHLSILSGKTKLAEELLGDFAEEETALRRKSVLEYCIYLYLRALYDKNDAAVLKASEQIRYYYENGHSDWRILWLLLYTDKNYEKNISAKLTDIREQFIAGCRSPILYYEAVCIINEEPFLLRELSEFEIQVCNFGIKNWILSKEAAQQYTYLAGKQKNFHPVVFEGLERLYDEFGSQEILTAICCMLIKGMKKSEKYFEWFRLGVKAQLRITELYEYYMYTVSDQMQEPLAQPVLLYFIYNSNLSDRKKAFLYANIVKNKDKNEAMYRTYYKRMEIFAVKMLESHHISYDLAVLYREFFGRNDLDAEMLRHLPYVMYRNELVCTNPNIVSAAVIHRELDTEEIVQLTEGRAQITIYTGNAEIFLNDCYGNRFSESVEYTVRPYMNSEEYENNCTQYSNHPMLLLHMFDRYQNLRILNPDAVENRKKVLQIEGLGKEFVTECCQALIEYYYENYNDELLDYYLNQLDLATVRPAERSRFIELLILRAFYERALQALETFGYGDLSVNRLIRLCTGMIAASAADNKRESMVLLCYHVFTHNKYDESILKFLIRYYNGTTREMFRLWQAAGGFELDTHKLEERLLTQMLFTESYIEDSFRVFHTYYREVSNHLLVRAFLSFYAYRYLVHNTVIAAELFAIMKRELYYEENDVCLLAWLKYKASNHQFSDNDLVFAEYNIARLIRKGITLPFFMEYNQWISLPDQLQGKHFITYHCDARKQVYIHYRLLGQNTQDYITERMPNVFLGIHSKELLLFHHEVLQYYITEEAEQETNITESINLQYDSGAPKEDDSKYNQINLMLIAADMKEDNTLLAMIGNYIKREYMVDLCFKPLE